MSAAGTGAIYAVELLPDGTYKVVYARAVTSVAGANSADISDSPMLSAQARWGYERFGGGSVLYQATAGAISPYLDASAVAAVGDIVPVAGTSPVTIGMRITQLYAPAPLSDRIATAEAQAASARDALSAALLATYPLAETVGDATATTTGPASISYWWDAAVQRDGPAASGADRCPGRWHRDADPRADRWQHADPAAGLADHRDRRG
jgi:hypothetical protein